MKSVYAGDEKVAEFESYDELRVGDGKPAFIYEGNELVYPNPVKDGLVLWYDFSGRTNTDGQRGIAEDLSGNGNHGTLQNFNFTEESGYDKNKLLFDGVDDFVVFQDKAVDAYTLEVVAKIGQDSQLYQNLIGTYTGTGAGGFDVYNYAPRLRIRASTHNGDRLFTANNVLEVGRIYHILITIRGNKIIFYINGKEVYSDDFNDYKSFQSTSSKGIYIGTYYQINSYRQTESTMSAKAYNRPLTPEEIAHNYAIEKERFGIE